MTIEQDLAIIEPSAGGATPSPAAQAPGEWREGDELVTYTGFTFGVRSAGANDELALAEFFTHVTKDDLRFRFLSAVQKVSQAQLNMLTHPDHRRTENFLAVMKGTGSVLASAMLAADDDMEGAEVAIVIRSEYKGQGIGWRLLQHVSERAAAMGIKTLQAIESHDNRAAIEVEREMGFVSRACPGDATLVILEKSLPGQPEAGAAVAA
jgi:GNAT superfamily N-acetyltransferase